MTLQIFAQKGAGTMVRSMTGYGRAQETLGGRDITVEIRAVNHRYFEYSSRLPRAYGYLDDKLKGLLQSAISRGKVDVSLTMQTIDGGGADVSINRTLAADYLRELRQLGEELGVKDDVTLSVLSRFSDIFTVRKAAEDEDQVWNDVRQVAEAAVERFVAMRQVEGQRLKADVLNRLEAIEEAVTGVEERSPQTVAEYRARLTAKLQELLQTTTIDQQRILTEAAIVAEKLAVDEETVRLRSHIAQLRDILELPEAVGRKLDFLVQEMNREANTIGSKAQDVQIARLVVDIKSNIEKIREQIQNIE